MQPVTALQLTRPLSPSSPSLPQSLPAPSLQEKEVREPPQSQPQPKPQHAPQRIPRLRAVVESQAFKNILVDEMDIMFSQAATLIQANWRGYQLRQKLVSQMMAAKAIQEAWRRFSTRRLLHSSKLGAKKVSKDEGDIPYHPPQQVRFHYPEDHPALSPPVMVNKKTQFPSRDNLTLSQPLATPGGAEPGMQTPCGHGTAGVVFLPPQTMATRLPCPMNLRPKHQPCLITKTVRSPCCSTHLEGDKVKSKHYDLSNLGPLKNQTQVHIEAVIKAPPLSCPVTKTSPKMHPGVSTLKSPAPMSTEPKASPQACPSSITPVMRNLPQTCAVRPMMTKAPVHMYPTSSLTSTTPQVRPAGTVARGVPQGCLLASSVKASPHPVAPMSRSPPQTSTGPGTTKTSPQTRPTSPTAKLSPQMRLAAMITKTPAQIRSVAAVLRTFCMVPPVVNNFKAPPQTPVAGVPNTSSQARLNTTRAKVTVNAKQTTGIAKAFSQSYLAKGKTEIKPAPSKLMMKERAPKTHTAMGMTRALSWTRVAEDRTKPPGQTHHQAEVIKVRSKVYTPVETPVTLSPAQMAIPSTKTLSNAQTPIRQARVQSHLATHPSRAPSHPPSGVADVTVALPKGHLATGPPSTMLQPQLATCVTKGSSQIRPPAKQSSIPSQARQATCPKKATSQGYPPTKLGKAPSLAHLLTCLTKVSSQGHIPIGLTKAHSQAQMVPETAKCLFTAHAPADLSSKTQSQPLLTGSKASVQFWQHFGSLDTGSQAKPEDKRMAQFQLHSRTQTKTTQDPCSVAMDTQGMLVPLLTSAGHPTCNAESWGDGVPSQMPPPPPPMPSQTMSCQDDVVISQIASLCAEALAALGSQEDLRALLVKALSQGEVRAAVSQALSREVLGATVVKTLPQSMLGMALIKALSWGELGVTLSRALSRGELRTELPKSVQSRLAEVLCKALSGEEQAALSQALCQGELGAVFSQSLSQVAQRTGTMLPKATSKSAASSMIMASTPVEVNCRGHLAVEWGPALGSVKPPSSKGPVDTMAGCQLWNLASPSVAVKPTDCSEMLPSMWYPTRVPRPWDPMGNVAVLDRKPSGELLVSMKAMNSIFVQAVVTIQACTRGYLVRRTIKVWHQWAIIIQATWRGYRVRKNLAQLFRATTIIQAAWRGYCARRDRACQVLLPTAWPEQGNGARKTSYRRSSNHCCFLSCQPEVCNFCQSLSPQQKSPSVVMLMGSRPRTCHVCGHTLSTRVVQGVGQGISGGTGSRWASASQRGSLCPQKNQAATAIQSAWRGFKTRRQLSRQQSAAKVVQANWRGHYTRSCLTTDALLGSGSPWDRSRDASRHSVQSQSLHWPGV
uniref:IQ domain-containing protein N n=1 Tax=Jaculus jaculus TaxID=51337 RepID=A0A8C5P2N2_JACJA